MFEEENDFLVEYSKHEWIECPKFVYSGKLSRNSKLGKIAKDDIASIQYLVEQARHIHQL